jgi:very-short-patch-repair endonuclease
LVLKNLRSKGYKSTPQWRVGSYHINLVVEGQRERLAIECDGDRFHTIENLQVDMERQAVLERLGWRFIRIRGSEFFRDPDGALAPLYERLERMGIEAFSEVTLPPETELSQRVIAEARRIRMEWEAEPDSIDDILGRAQSAEDLDEEESSTVLPKGVQLPASN